MADVNNQFDAIMEDRLSPEPVGLYEDQQLSEAVDSKSQSTGMQFAPDVDTTTPEHLNQPVPQVNGDRTDPYDVSHINHMVCCR